MRHITHAVRGNGLSHLVHDSGDENAPPAILLHGFPDSSAAWRRITPLLVASGFRVVAPDMRGFGETDMAPQVADYDIRTGALVDVLAIMDALSIGRAHLVGHDFGAPVAWALAAQHPDRFRTLAALSVGHPRAFLKAGREQRKRSFYILVHQFRGLCEALYRANDWALLRKHWSRHDDIDEAIRLLARPGRLTAGLNWYRANMSLRRIVSGAPDGAFGEETVRIPTLGLYSDGDVYLTEEQMTGSKDYVAAPWSYARLDGVGHWLQVEAADRVAALLLGHWRDHSNG